MKNNNSRLPKKKAKHDFVSILKLLDYPISTSKQVHLYFISVILFPSSRAAFENEGLTQARERLALLNTLIESEQLTLTKLEEQKVKAEDDIKASEEDIAELRQELKDLQEILEEKSKIVDQVKKTTLRASKVLDQALKEIAACVRFYVVLRAF